MIYVASLIGILLFRQNRLLKNLKFILVLFIIIIIAAGHITLNAQITTVFSDNFNRASLTPGGTPSMTYSTVVTAGDGGASINGSNFLQITNDNSGAANALGMTFITGPLSTYASPFINTLTSNDGVIEWTFNMRYGRTTAPSGFDGGNYGIAAVLAASSSDLTTANGYAIVYGGTETTKRYKLVSFKNGLDINSNITDIISNTSSAPANFNNYVSLRVRYNPSTHEWYVYLRDNGYFR